MKLRRALTLALFAVVLAACATPAVQPAPVAPTAVPATAVPPTAVPDTAVPPTAIPPTAAPATQAPPTAVVEPTVAPTTAAGPVVAGTGIDLDYYFPLVDPADAAGRDAALLECTACHTIAPIVIAAKSPTAWAQLMTEHRRYLPTTPEEVYAIITQYLVHTYTPEREIPELPPELAAGFVEY